MHVAATMATTASAESRRFSAGTGAWSSQQRCGWGRRGKGVRGVDGVKGQLSRLWRAEWGSRTDRAMKRPFSIGARRSDRVDKNLTLQRPYDSALR
eukprot:353619-Chlamydomonas_euryale.AAC.3